MRTQGLHQAQQEVKRPGRQSLAVLRARFRPSATFVYTAAMVELEPCRTEADERLSLEIYNAVCPDQAFSLADVRDWKASVIDHVDLVARLDGKPAGSAIAAIMPSKPDMAFIVNTVLPPARGRGVGTALYQHAAGWAEERGVASLESRVAEGDDASLAFARRRGFAEISRQGRLVLELAGVEPPPVDPPDGITIVPYDDREDLDGGLYETARDSFPDIPGNEDWVVPPFEHWRRHHLHGSTNRPDATFVALAGDDVVGYAKFGITEARPGTAMHQMTCVKRAWRGRGVASALKRAQIAWAKANGFDRLETENEERNAPMLRVNEKLGYRPAPGVIYVRRELARAPS